MRCEQDEEEAAPEGPEEEAQSSLKSSKTVHKVYVAATSNM